MEIKSAARLAMKNRAILEQNQSCGCYHCLETFQFNEIIQWTDNSQTALCPRCNIDSVLPLTEGVDLKAIRDYWV